jgi:hypothetical protein
MKPGSHPHSRQANYLMEPVKPKHRDLVYASMVKYNTNGNYQTIANDVRKEHPHMTDEQVRKRLPEMLLRGMIKITGHANTLSGCTATTYAPVVEVKQTILFSA